MRTKSTRSAGYPGNGVGTAAADAGCACGKACGGLERRGIDPAVRRSGSRPGAGCRRAGSLRREEQYREVPSGQGRCAPDSRSRTGKCGSTPEPGTARDARPGRLRPGSRNRKTVAAGADHPALPARPEATPPMERRGPAALPAPPLAIGRVPRRGQDLARAGPRRAARLGQHEDPVLPGGRRDQLKRLAAAFCARFPAVGTIRMRGTPLSALLARQAGPGRRMPARVARLRAARPRSDRHRNTPRNLRKAA